MAQCTFHEFCGLEIGEGDAYCILHSRNPNKSHHDFASALEHHRNTRGDTFTLFYFTASQLFPNGSLQEASFINATFAGRVNFAHKVFKGNTSFSGVTFANAVDFSKATFTGERSFVSFQDVKFLAGVNFLETIFESDALFSRAQFKSEAFFGKAQFRRKANFEHTRFMTSGFFYDAIFSEFETRIDDAVFRKDATFRKAVFHGQTYFIGAQLNNADFGNATFHKSVDFNATSFTNAHFDETFFTAEHMANFFHCSFKHRAIFSGKDETNKIFEKVEVGFGDVNISPPQALIFRNADLQRCLFRNTDLRNVEFTSVNWVKIGLRYGVYDDEKARLVDSVNAGWGGLQRLYRDLKQNFEDRRNYDLAGDFHYGEKEMQERDRSTPFPTRAILKIYRLTSGYGENYFRPLGWSTVLLIVCAFAYLELGIATKDGVRLSTANLKDWLTTLHFSLRTMTFLKPDDLVPFGTAKFVATLESLIGPFLLALFALALRQRLRR